MSKIKSDPVNQRVKPYPEIYNLWEISDNNET